MESALWPFYPFCPFVESITYVLSTPCPRPIPSLATIFQSHYLYVVSALQVAGGVLLLVNRYVPLGLVLLGPVIVNIFLFHVLMDRSGLPLAIVVVILWGIVALRQRQYLAGIFVKKSK